MNYTKEKIIEMVGTDIADHGNWVRDINFEDDFIGADTFWNSQSIKRKGKTNDTDEYYGEVISEFLLENGFVNKNCFIGIKQITRKNPYCTNEEYSAVASDLARLYSRFNLENRYGSIIASIVSLSNYSDDNAGVIDLLTYKQETNEIFILEVKPYCSDESLLGAVLEIQTYYQTMDKEKLINDFYSAKKISSQKAKIRKAIILFSDSNPYNEYKENRPNTAKIIEKFEIEVFLIKSSLSEIAS